MALSGRGMASALVMACGHCGGLRRVRVEGDFVSCDSCGKVLLQQQRGRKQRAVEAEARRRRRWLGARKRRDGRGGGMVFGPEASDSESDTGCVSSVESSS